MNDAHRNAALLQPPAPWHRGAVIALALLAVVALAGGYWMTRVATGPCHVYWTGDSALKALQVRQLALHGSPGLTMPHQGPAHQRHPPFPAPFSRAVDDGRAIVYPALFAWSALPWYLALGDCGLLAWTALIAACVVLLTWRLGTLAGFQSPWLGALVLAVLSPWPIYAITYNEHGLGVLPALAALLMWPATGRVWPALAMGLLAGLGPWIRPELYAWILALGLALAWHGGPLRVRRVTGYALGVALSLTPLAAHLLLRDGLPLGSRITGQAFVSSAATPFQVVADWSFWEQPYSLFLRNPLLQLIGFGYDYPLLAAWGVGLALAIVLMRLGPGPRLHAVGAWITVAFAAFVAWRAWLGGEAVIGLLAAMPMAWLACLRGAAPQQPLRGAWRDACIIHALLVLFLLVHMHGGRQWGARYLLPLAPYLALAAGEQLSRLWQARRHRLVTAMAALALLALTLPLQASALRFVAHETERYARYLDYLQQRPERHVVFDERWLPQALAGLLDHDRRMYLAHHDAMWTPDPLLGDVMRDILTDLRDEEVTHALYVTLPSRLEERLHALREVRLERLDDAPLPVYRVVVDATNEH